MIPITDFLKKIIWPLEEIDKILPQRGLIYDLGCGEGVIAKYLANSSASRRVIGVDVDKKRLPKIKSQNLSFEAGDIRSFRLETADGVIISDVLHHLSAIDQKKLLIKISQCLKKGGVLVIKEIDKNEFIRGHLSRLWDFLLYPKDKIHYWRSNDLRVFLKSLGFAVKITHPVRLFPGSTTLYICKK